MVDLESQARQLVQNLDGSLSTSAYDVAWMARVPADSEGGARWPELVTWLLYHQWPDGSWGGTTPYYHDRILCTLSAIIALKENGTSRRTADAIRRGAKYVWLNSHFLHHDPIELVGFELIFPTLLVRARTLGLDVPAHSYGYRRLRAKKLRLLPTELLYERGTSVAFSIEFLDAAADPDKLARLQGGNGAIANSPAATVYSILEGSGNRASLRYLEGMRARPPAFYPWRTFEIAWTLEHLAFGGLSLNGLVAPSIWSELQAALDFGETGVGIDPTFGINDGDTTAVTLHVLAQGDQAVDPMILRHFESARSGVFHTFPFERNPSVVTNAHALEAMHLIPDYPDRQDKRDRIVTMMLSSQIYESYWIDKWHASPYYATAHVLLALMGMQEPLLAECHNSIEWLVHTQRSDGSWGFFDWGTVEETAYALLALLHYHRRVKAVDEEVLKRGAVYLYHCMAQKGLTHPELWIAKSLYAPKNIVKAAILAATNLYQETLGHVPG